MAQYRKDENDNTTSGAEAGGTTGERVELNWTSFYRLDNWQLAGGVEYLQRLFTQRGPVSLAIQIKNNTTPLIACLLKPTVNLLTTFSLR
jgi:vitamin B12 transporter